MADIVLAIGTSHSPLLNSPAEDYPKHAAIDASGRKLIDKNGKPCTYGELLEQADPSIKRQIEPKVLEQRSARCSENIARLSRELADAKLDALIIIGDDQHEQFFDDNMPAILVYWGETIENNPLHMDEDAPAILAQGALAVPRWRQAAQFPVDAKLGRHLIEQLVEQGFDVSHSRRLSKEHGEGHAFGFVHVRMMNEATSFRSCRSRSTPIFRPTSRARAAATIWARRSARRCKAPSGNARVGILASGGLSHFTVDEELDRGVLAACKNNDGEALASIPVEKLNSGSSEIRNWITVAGAAGHLKNVWQDYIPCYRSAAGTGCGMGFALWK